MKDIYQFGYLVSITTPVFIVDHQISQLFELTNTFLDIIFAGEQLCVFSLSYSSRCIILRLEHKKKPGERDDA